MIVGEPSLMGGEMDDEDERFISRLENSQYDPNITSQYHSPIQQLSQSYQQNSYPPSLINQKQQYLSNSTLLQPHQMKREQLSFPGSPAQQPLTSISGIGMVSTILNSSVNGENSVGGRRISATNNNSPQTPANINQNQV